MYHFIIEATGTYSTKLVYALCQAQIFVRVICPHQSRAFAKMRNKITKNDQSDSQLLAKYGALNAADLTPYRLPEEPYVDFLFELANNHLVWKVSLGFENLILQRLEENKVVSENLV